MQNQSITIRTVAFLAAVASSQCPGYASDLLSETVTAGGVTATVTVAPSASVRNDFLIWVTFKTSKDSVYPVGCLSAYRDLRYTLRDGDGNLIPVDQETLQHPPFEGPSIVLPHPGVSQSCADRAPNGVLLLHARFSALFPNLVPGTYTLRVSFTPRGTSQSADFAPVLINIQTAPGTSYSPRPCARRVAA